jgi:Arc/MetJ-type ribon-helix-helix transcriptional regulator
MTVALPREQMEWLRAEVEAGRYASIDEALAVAVAELMAAGTSDLAWVAPFVQRARDAVARGDVISAGDFAERMSRRIEAQKVS